MREQRIYGDYNPDTGYQYSESDIEQMRKQQMEKDWQEYEAFRKSQLNNNKKGEQQ